MRVLCDVHIPYRLVNRLRELGVDATHVNRVLNGSATNDSAISAFVDENGMLLITKDGDFRDSHFLTGSPARVLRLTLGNLSNTALIALVEASWQSITACCHGGSCYIELSRDGMVLGARPDAP
jgi:predicted nuclease of predicted toxin-antitoxin system